MTSNTSLRVAVEVLRRFVTEPVDGPSDVGASA